MAFGLILVGDELLTGKRRDRHFDHMVRLLGDRGLTLTWSLMIGDDEALIRDTLRQTFASGDIVFSFGGIGATPDDRTRQAAAAALNRLLVVHPRARAELESQFGAATYPHRIHMAEFPEGAELIPNPVNRVPGFSVGDHHFVPGFPHMAWPMAEWVLEHRYRDRYPVERPQEFLLRAFGTGESDLVPVMEAVLAAVPGVRLSSLPHVGEQRFIELGLRGAPTEAARAYHQLWQALQETGVHVEAVNEPPDTGDEA